jgi:hypothetical protein
MVLRGLDGSLVVLLVGPRAGEEDFALAGPGDDGFVNELGAVVENLSDDFERHLLDRGLQNPGATPILWVAFADLDRGPQRR